MSATLDSEIYSDYFRLAGTAAPEMLHVGVKRFPVEEVGGGWGGSRC